MLLSAPNHSFARVPAFLWLCGLLFGGHMLAANCGPPTFACSRTDVSVTQPDASPTPNFGGISGANNLIHDQLYNNVQIVRCTDGNSDPANRNQSYEVGLGGAGDKNSWNLNDTMLAFESLNGITYLYFYDPVAKSCRPVCSDGDADLHCLGSTLYKTNRGVFSKTDPTKYFKLNSTGVQIQEITVVPGAPPSAGVIVADFSPVLYRGTNPDWKASHFITLGTVIEPVQNNGSGQELFQAITTGVTGTTEPAWTNTIEPYLGTNHTALPLSRWPGANQGVPLSTKIQPPLTRDAGKYIFKATVAGSTGSSQPTWCQTTSCTVSDGTVTWTNVGASSTITDGTVTWVKVGPTGTQTWDAIAGIERSDQVFGIAVSYSSSQDTGVWALAYDSLNNRMYQLNTYTKIETDYVCVSGTGFNCAGGTWTPNPPHMLSGSDNITIHNILLSLDGTTMEITCGIYGGPCTSANKLWYVGTGSWGEITVDTDGHDWMGYTHRVNQGAGGQGDAATQKYFTIRDNNNVGTTYPYWHFSPCTDVALTNPPYPHPPCYPQFDEHLSWIYNKGSDEEPTIGATFVNGNAYPAVSPWQFEIIGVSSCGLTGEPACPSGYPSNTTWRFGRTFNFNYKSTGSNFYALASIGALSQTGNYYALTSMGLGTMGSTAGSNSCAEGFSWAKSFNYRNGAEITPYSQSANYTFSASCSGSCASGSTEPVWSRDGVTPVTDNQVTWTPIGQANCRSDILIYKLQ